MKIDSRVTAIFANVLSPETARALTLDSSKDTVPGWDSQTFVTIVVAIEAEFDVVLSTLDAARMHSVRSIHEVLGEKGVALAT
jgi:acyl carrier protein